MHIPTKFLLPSTMRLLESVGICVLEYKRKPIEMIVFQWGFWEITESIVVPPGIVFYSQVAVYHHFSEMKKG